jgi:hypothetical protein
VAGAAVGVHLKEFRYELGLSCCASSARLESEREA